MSNNDRNMRIAQQAAINTATGNPAKGVKYSVGAGSAQTATAVFKDGYTYRFYSDNDVLLKWGSGAETVSAANFDEAIPPDTLVVLTNDSGTDMRMAYIAGTASCSMYMTEVGRA